MPGSFATLSRFPLSAWIKIDASIEAKLEAKDPQDLVDGDIGANGGPLK